MIDKLSKELNENYIDQAIQTIEEIGEKKLNEAVPYLIEQLESTENALIRNSIALALSDIGNPEALEPIVKQLKNPKTEGYRGTLLASLERFDYSIHLDMLVNFIMEGNFEVSRKSFLMIEAVIQNITEEKRKEYMEIIKDEIERLEDKTDLLYEVVDIFNMQNDAK
ncbi:HEAT repeat domain-containing protein [Paenibacillus kandeliae]|uniref:HEAT repeat domain-containing protein n=1 Tax=Paenibacillus kandeliae TaxID=3231269 RepID=UPI003459D04C